MLENTDLKRQRRIGAYRFLSYANSYGYYLRSTDYLAAAPPNKVQFAGPELNDCFAAEITVFLTRNPWTLRISGRFAGAMASVVPKEGCMGIKGDF